MTLTPSSLSRPAGVGVGEAVAIPPPEFCRVPIEVMTAWECENPHAKNKSSSTAAQRAGRSYERRIVKDLGARLVDWEHCLAPWFCYTDLDGGRRYCSPDLVLRRGRRVVLCEIKLRWTIDAWWQLRRLYAPVVAKAWKIDTPILVTLCKSFDPARPKPPEIFRLMPHFDIDTIDPAAFNVCVVP